VSLTDWDILFLIPLPWIGPVFAPLIIALGMVFTGVLLVLRLWRGKRFRPDRVAWVLALAGTVVLLYSFMSDTGATLHEEGPRPYVSEFLVASMVLYTLSYLRSCALLPRMPSSSHEIS
jgi:drug/metabolite transporter (DMT)-like permease